MAAVMVAQRTGYYLEFRCFRVTGEHPTLGLVSDDFQLRQAAQECGERMTNDSAAGVELAEIHAEFFDGRFIEEKHVSVLLL